MPTRARIYRPKQAAPRHTREPEARGSRHERGYNSRWARFAKAYLAQNPLCRTCQDKGRVAAAFCVDHIDGKGPLGERGYDPTNLQPLCESCHNRKTASEQRHPERRRDS